MKFAILITILISVSAIFATEPIASKNYVIFDSEGWKPSKTDAEKALKAVVKFLKKEEEVTSDNHLKNQIGQILNSLSKYKIQISGIIKNGKKKVYLSFFFDNGDPENWRKYRVMVSDGGYTAWQINYDQQKSQFSDFHINGEI